MPARRTSAKVGAVVYRAFSVAKYGFIGGQFARLRPGLPGLHNSETLP